MDTFIRYLLVLGALSSRLCFCNEDDTSQGFIEQRLVQLIAEQDTAIIGYSDDRCYLNADKISVVDKEILLVTDSGDELPISSLAADSFGIYTTVCCNSSIYATVFPVIRCKKCNTPFSPNFFNRGKCPCCGEQN